MISIFGARGIQHCRRGTRSSVSTSRGLRLYLRGLGQSNDYSAPSRPLRRTPMARGTAIFDSPSTLRTPGAERNLLRSGSLPGSEFASFVIVACSNISRARSGSERLPAISAASCRCLMARGRSLPCSTWCASSPAASPTHSAWSASSLRYSTSRYSPAHRSQKRPVARPSRLYHGSHSCPSADGHPETMKCHSEPSADGEESCSVGHHQLPRVLD